MILLKQQAGLLRSVRSWGVLGLVLALAVLPGCNLISNLIPGGKPGPMPASPCIQPPSDLVAWWPMDETSGTTANDIAGVPNNGTLVNGPTWISGKVAGALRFDGQDDYVQVPNDSELNVGTGSFTLDAWVRTTASSGVVVLVDKRTGTGFATTAQGYSLFLTNGRLGFQMANGVGPGICTPAPGGSSCVNYGQTGPNVADGQWHHVAAVVDRSDLTNGVRLYVDGNLVFSGAPLGAPPTGNPATPANLDNSSDLYMGVRTPGQGGGGYFPGDLDELELFKRALSQDEIQQIYKAGPAGKCKNKADLAVQKRLAPASPWQVGQPAQFVISVSNQGPDPVPAGTAITVTDPIPAGMNYTGFSGTGWSCTPPSGTGPVTVTCTYTGGLAPGQAAPPLILNVTPTQPGKFENCAGVTSPLPDPKPDNNRSCAGGEAQPSPQAEADLGDAPDSTNHKSTKMTAYPGVTANFPTVFDPATGLPQGPKHLNPKGLAWLGKDVSFENEADLLPDADGITNIDPSSDAADRDKFDDGVALPIAIPMNCGQTQFKYTVTNGTSNSVKLYVNVWFDFNRDGDWDDPIQKCPLGPAVTGSFTEWAVQNEPITVNPGANTFTTPVFGAANPTKGSEMWMRITLTDQPIAPANGADGSGPATGYKYGETEDYLLRLTYTELCGVKFNDLNGNGKQDPGEPGLANWVIEVKDANGNIMGYAVTDENGKYCIVVPSPGTYIVSEQQQQGWTQTAPPAPGTYTVTVPPAHTDLNFGNQEKVGKAEICIFKFNDLNGNGRPDSGEPPLPGWSFTVSPAPLPPATSPVTTGPEGRVCFGVTAPGSYTITEQVQSGWMPTTPNPQTVTVQPGQLVNVFFGNKKEEGKCDLKIEKKVQPSPLVSGQQAAVTITVTNVGNAPCPGPTAVSETVPSGLTLVSASGPGWTCVGPVCTYPLPIPVNGSVSVTYTFNVTAPPGTAITNCATVSNPNDTNPANNQACVTTPVVPGAVCDLAIRKSVSPNPVASGGSVTITLVVTNVGTAPCPPGPFPGTIVRDNKPTGIDSFTLTPATAPPGWQCGLEVPSGNLTCATQSTLPVGYTATFTFTAKVTAPPGSQIQNCAQVTNVGDANQANNNSCVTISVIGIPPPPVDLALAKLLEGVLRPEAEVTYVLRVQNVGGAPTSSAIRVSDPLPPTLRFISATGAGWNCSAQGQNVVCTSAGPIAPNQSSTILLRVRVAAPAGTQITNCATVETAGDSNPTNNRGCHTGTVQR